MFWLFSTKDLWSQICSMEGNPQFFRWGIKIFSSIHGMEDQGITAPLIWKWTMVHEGSLMRMGVSAPGEMDGFRARTWEIALGLAAGWLSCLRKVWLSLSFPFLFFPFRATLAAYGGSQARGRNEAAAAGLSYSHSNVGSELRLPPTAQLMAMPERCY